MLKGEGPGDTMLYGSARFDGINTLSKAFRNTEKTPKILPIITLQKEMRGALAHGTSFTADQKQNEIAVRYDTKGDTIVVMSGSLTGARSALGLLEPIKAALFLHEPRSGKQKIYELNFDGEPRMARLDDSRLINEIEEEFAGNGHPNFPYLEKLAGFSNQDRLALDPAIIETARVLLADGQRDEHQEIKAVKNVGDRTNWKTPEEHQVF